MLQPTVNEILRSRNVTSKLESELRAFFIDNIYTVANEKLIIDLKALKENESNNRYIEKIEWMISSIESYLNESSFKKRVEKPSQAIIDMEYTGYFDLKPVRKTKDLYFAY